MKKFWLYSALIALNLIRKIHKSDSVEAKLRTGLKQDVIQTAETARETVLLEISLESPAELRRSWIHLGLRN